MYSGVPRIVVHPESIASGVLSAPTAKQKVKQTAIQYETARHLLRRAVLRRVVDTEDERAGQQLTEACVVVTYCVVLVFRQSKVCQLDVAVVCDQNVLRL